MECIFCFNFSTSSFNSLIRSKPLTGPPSWRGSPGEGERRRGPGWLGRSWLRGAAGSQGGASVTALFHRFPLSGAPGLPSQLFHPVFVGSGGKKLAGLLRPPSGYTGEAISIAFSQKGWSVRLERVKGFDIILKEVVCSTFAYIASISSTVT